MFFINYNILFISVQNPKKESFNCTEIEKHAFYFMVAMALMDVTIYTIKYDIK